MTRPPVAVDATRDPDSVDLIALIAVVNGHLASGGDVLVVLGAPPAPDDLALGCAAIADDPRVATVSVGPLGITPVAAHETVGVEFAAGSAVLVAARAAALVGGLEVDPEEPDLARVLVDFSLRARGRGLFDLAVAEPTGSAAPVTDLLDDEWLARRHPTVLAGLRRERAERGDELATVPRAPIASVGNGDLRVLIDDTTLGPYETGAQITTLALIRALAARDDVATVGVALKFGAPEYARAVLSLPKVEQYLRPGLDYAGFPRFDVLHRTTQPDAEFSVAAARQCASRVVVSLLDLIGFRSGAYFATADEWVAYRQAIRAAVAAADAVTTISADVARAVGRERLPADRSHLFPVLYGTDHLTGREPAELPPGIVQAGRVADEFVLCLGTDYLHKNRDLALRVHRALREGGRTETLVLAGAAVPNGGSSEIESALLADGADAGDVVVLPSVRPEERNWLLKHATVVLYPTAAEGFGLVPFEAARFGSPTVHVRFGPFLETLPAEGAVGLDGWDPVAFADRVAALLGDPAARRNQVAATLSAAARLRWADTVDQYVVMYRSLLATRGRAT